MKNRLCRGSPTPRHLTLVPSRSARLIAIVQTASRITSAPELGVAPADGRAEGTARTGAGEGRRPRRSGWLLAGGQPHRLQVALLDPLVGVPLVQLRASDHRRGADRLEERRGLRSGLRE